MIKIMRQLSYLLALLGTLLISSLTRADHFTIDLEVKSPKANRTVHAETLGLGVKPKERAVLEIQAGDKVTLQWTLANATPKETVKDVLVHFYAVKIEKAGDRPPQRLDKDVLLESALTMDFKPKDKTQGELTLQVTQPGVYLLRLETKGAAIGPDGHEHFANLDVVAR